MDSNEPTVKTLEARAWAGPLDGQTWIVRADRPPREIEITSHATPEGRYSLVGPLTPVDGSPPKVLLYRWYYDRAKR